ncbi:MAG TPA: 3-phosphoshikimate 1-carboxyvinyltransferase [Thermoanaerobaculia bacterium]
MTAAWSTSTDSAVVPAGAVARGTVRLPGSKSVTHRAFALALVARRELVVERPLLADDTELALAALATLGCDVERRPEAVTIRPADHDPAGGAIDCGNAGTLLRFLVAITATIPGRWRLDGVARLRERPVGPLAAALAALGVEIAWEGRAGFAPLVVHGGELAGGRVALDAGESSQYLSALLLAGQRAAGPITVEATALASSPYAELTAEMIRRLGGTVERPSERLWRMRPSALDGGHVEVEPDLSAAAYPAAAAALTGGDVLLAGVSMSSLQGDRRFLELLAQMGATVVEEVDGVRVRGGELVAIEGDLADIPDQVPTLAALAPFARGTTRITNVAQLRVKESDRLAAMAAELRRAGAEVDELADGLVIPGVWARSEPPSVPVPIDPHGDHRIAMAMALVGLRRPNLAIRSPRVVTKSWPGFWETLGSLLTPPGGATLAS